MKKKRIKRSEAWLCGQVAGGIITSHELLNRVPLCSKADWSVSNRRLVSVLYSTEQYHVSYIISTGIISALMLYIFFTINHLL